MVITRALFLLAILGLGGCGNRHTLYRAPEHQSVILGGMKITRELDNTFTVEEMVIDGKRYKVCEEIK